MPCAHCGGAKPPGRGRLYCSKQCRDNAYEARQREMPDRNVTSSPDRNVTSCARCGKPLAASKTRPRTHCSARCRKLAERERIAAREAETAQADWTPAWGDNSTRAA